MLRMIVLGMVLGCMLTASARADDPGSPPAQVNKRLLCESDFRYVGYYRVYRDGNLNQLAELESGQGFTHRYVNGELRFLVLSFFGNVPGGGNQLIEFAAPASLGGTVTTRTGHWPGYMDGTGLSKGGGKWMGLWYEQAKERLWTTWAVDYPSDLEATYTKSLVIRTLNSDGTVSNVQGPWGLEGIQQRRIYGGVQAIPQWFQNLYSVEEYAVGWGGYASRMSEGVSMGPTCYAIPEPTGYAIGDIPASAFKTLTDHRSGTRMTDWYADGAPTSFDRGVRNSDVINGYEPPYWLSPAPDGLGRWVWGDSNWNTGCWIETATRFGFVTVPKFCNGQTWYASTLRCQRQSAEIQIFDPHHFGQAAQGARASWAIYPTSRWEISGDCARFGLLWGRSGFGPGGGPAGATYDPITKRLYIYCVGGNTNYNSYILIYDVGPIVGDINGDSHVDVVDLLYLAHAWGSQEGQAHYNIACDFNQDGAVDVIDLLMLVENWGR